MTESMAEDHLWELENLLCCIDELLLEGGHTAAFLQWKADAETAIRCAFGERSREVSMFANIRYTPLTHAACLSDGDKAVAFQRGLAQARLVLQTLARRLREGRSG